MDILQRVLYMVTLSLVDIDKDENGQPKHHFLIKRAIGMPGDRIRMREGNVEFLTPGESTWMTEPAMKQDMGFTYPNTRIHRPDEYPQFKNAGIARALEEEGAGLPTTAAQKTAVNRYYQLTRDSKGGLTIQLNALNDEIYVDLWRFRTKWALEPYNAGYKDAWRLLEEGYPVPEGRLFPMGDNRDNSRDARYFGPVRLEKVLGKGLFRYWPIARFGGVR